MDTEGFGVVGSVFVDDVPDHFFTRVKWAALRIRESGIGLTRGGVLGQPRCGRLCWSDPGGLLVERAVVEPLVARIPGRAPSLWEV